MEAIVGVWLSSLLGAGAFSTMGYILGQRGVVISFLRLPEGAAAPPPPAPAPAPATLKSVPPKQARARTSDTGRPPVDLSDPDSGEGTGAMKTHAVLQNLAAAEHEHARATAATSPVASLIDDDDEEKSTAARRSRTDAKIPAAKTEPPNDEALRAARGETEAARRELQAMMAILEGTKSELDVALARVQEANKAARTADASRADLERQLEVIRTELRREVVARAAAEEKALELGDRLARASEETAGLRHKLSLRPQPSSDRQRLRELEEIEDLRNKVREVSVRLEKSSAAPPPPAPSSKPPVAKITLAPKEADEVAKLREENTRLTKENRSLLARALGAAPERKPAKSWSDVDIEAYRSVVDRVAAVGGIRGAVLADEVGSVLLGRGELADGLAAFGAYIRDASSRTERLLPIESVMEIDIRDRKGMVLSTRVVTPGPGTLSVVFLGTLGNAVNAAKRIVDESPR
jgi:hypothetical protein